jgi:hypothetical protein
MGPRNEDINDSGHGMKPIMESQGKKLYRSPRFMIYGDLSRLTMTKGGNKSEGTGNPPTRATGG